MIDIPHEAADSLAEQIRQSYNEGLDEQAYRLSKLMLEHDGDGQAMLSAASVLEGLAKFREAIWAYERYVDMEPDPRSRRDAFARIGHCYRGLAKEQEDVSAMRTMYNAAKQHLMFSLSGPVTWSRSVVRAGITLVDVLRNLGEPGTALYLAEILSKHPGFEVRLSEVDNELLKKYVRNAIDDTRSRT